MPSGPRRSYKASLPRSPVRIRITSSRSKTKIFPSPIFPVCAAVRIRSTTAGTSSSFTAASILTLGMKSTTYSAPRYTSECPFCRPNPFTSRTVIPVTPASVSAFFTSSTLNGLMIASIFFMVFLPSRIPAALAGEVSQVEVGVGNDRHLVLIEPLELVLGVDPQPQRQVEELEHDVADDGDVDDVRQRPDALCEELRGVPVEESLHRPGDAVPAVAVGAVREQPEGEHAPGPVHPVDRDRAHRVVDLECPLDEEDGDAQQDPRDHPDEDRDGSGDESAGGGDRHQAGKEPVCGH